MLQLSFSKLTIAVLGFSLFLTACENKPSVRTGRSVEQTAQPEVEPTIGKPDNFDYGKVENNVYSNSYFNCTMNVPKGWVVRDKEEADKLHKEVIDQIGDENQQLKEAIDASDINSANLLGVSKFRLDTPTPSNPNLIMVAENISSNPAIKTGKDYLLSGKKMMQGTGINYEFLDEPKEEFINGKRFYTMNVIMHLSTDVHQRYYVTISKGFAVGIIEAYTNEKEGEFMKDYVYSLKFEKEK